MFIPGRAKFRLAEINIIVRGRLNLNRYSVATRNAARAPRIRDRERTIATTNDW